MDVFGLFDVPLWLVLISVLLAWLVHHAYSGFDHFEKRGITTVQPVHPFVGNIWGCWKRNNRLWQLEQVRKYGRVFGSFDGKNPVLWVTDPEVIKAILVKEFDSFTDHRLFSDGLAGVKYVRKFLFVTGGEEWKDARNSVTPAFSSGKIKKMSRIMESCCERLVDDARGFAQGSGEVDVRELLGRMVLDVNARCAFGTTIDNLSDPKNPFMVNSQAAFRPALFDSPWALIPELYPWTQIFGLEALVNGKAMDFFVNLVEQIIRQRKQEDPSAEKRGDFLDVLLEELQAEEEKMRKDPTAKKVLTDEVFISQCVTFFAAGFDTVGTTMAVTVHYLAMNPHCQEILRDEVAAKKKEHKDVLNHETVQDCPYLDQVIQETLRISPTDLIIERGCTKSCEIDGIKFRKGDNVVIPMWSLQHMEEYFPDPDKFDPERFAPENKSKLTPYTYFPFGLGPRKCIGMRFAVEESKLAVANLVLNFKFSKCPKTNHPPKVAGSRLVSMPYDMYLKIEERM